MSLPPLQRARRLRAAVLVVALSSTPTLSPAQRAPEPPQNAVAGSRVFGARCVECHAVRGLGGRVGPDLGEISARHSFDDLAATMWNHVPNMAARMRERGIEGSRILPREAGDLFAYLQTLDYFDPPGNPGLGRTLFSDKQCVLCHQVGGIGGVIGPSLDYLGGFRSPIPIAAAMWNHGPAMAEEMRARGVTRPTFTGRELEDLIAFLRSTMGVPPDESTHVLPGRVEAGRQLFSAKGCVTCHGARGGGGVGPALAGRGAPAGMSDFAARMWNKAPAMTREMTARGISVPELSAAEMADIVAYLYAMGYFAGSGNPGTGRRLLEARCAACHVAYKAPQLGQGQYVSAAQVFAAMWNHAAIPTVADREWPPLTDAEVADIVSYLTTPR
jgi:mono/diheme cytochrome c family protein